MCTIDFRNRQQYVFSKLFCGLPHSQVVLIFYLLSLADKCTGIVEGITYADLQQLLFIKPAPGRKESGMPTKQSIRNFIKSIERECPKDFKVVTEGQKLRFIFPTMPGIFEVYAQADVDSELNTVHDIPESIASTGDEGCFGNEQNTEVNTLPDIPESVKKNNIYTNNSTNCGMKKPIDPHFKPSREVLDIAKGRGYLRAEEPDEIAAFIRYNQMHQTVWADFNAVYLLWLENGSRYSQQQETRRKISTENSRSSNHGNGRKKTSGNIVELVAFHNQGAEHPGEEVPFNCPTIVCENDQSQSFEMALAEIDECVWATFHESTRPVGQRYLV